MPHELAGPVEPHDILENIQHLLGSQLKMSRSVMLCHLSQSERRPLANFGAVGRSARARRLHCHPHGVYLARYSWHGFDKSMNISSLRNVSSVPHTADMLVNDFRPYEFIPRLYGELNDFRRMIMRSFRRIKIGGVDNSSDRVRHRPRCPLLPLNHPSPRPLPDPPFSLLSASSLTSHHPPTSCMHPRRPSSVCVPRRP